jgi:hypothetical protein
MADTPTADLASRLTVEDAQKIKRLQELDEFAVFRRELQFIRTRHIEDWINAPATTPNYELQTAMKRGLIRGIDQIETVLSLANQVIEFDRRKRKAAEMQLPEQE